MADDKAVSPSAAGGGDRNIASTIPGASMPDGDVGTVVTESAALEKSDTPPLVPALGGAAPEVMVDGPSVSAPEIQAAVKPEIRQSPAADDAPSGKPASAAPQSIWPSVHLPSLSRRARRRAVIAATIAAAACLGATVGAVAVGVYTSGARSTHEVKIVEERAAMQKTIEQLGKQVATLRSGLDSAGKSANAQIARLTEKVKDAEKAADQARRAAAAPETTGSIPTTIPVPIPKPAIKATASASAKPAIVDGWFVHSARNGLVLVEGRGELYEVVPGAPLPGLGRVEAIRREDGRWVVVTQKGLIVAMRGDARPAYRRY
jgi:uncharacterized coiled-coil protein SlyX